MLFTLICQMCMFTSRHESTLNNDKTLHVKSSRCHIVGQKKLQLLEIVVCVFFLRVQQDREREREREQRFNSDINIFLTFFFFDRHISVCLFCAVNRKKNDDSTASYEIFWFRFHS